MDTSGASVYASTPFSGPFAAAFTSELISSTVVLRFGLKVRSTTDTLIVGTRMAKPSSLPLSCGSTRPTAAAAQVLVVHIGEHLVVGVGVDGGHQARLDADGIVQHLGQRRQAVGGARGVGDHRHRRSQRVVVHAVDHGAVDIAAAGSGDQHALGATGEVG